MLQIDTFNMSKLIAKVPLGPRARDSFTYRSDVKAQWGSSYSSSKIVELIGGQSMPTFNLTDVQRWLGSLSDSEEEFSRKFTAFYQDLVKLLTTVEVPVSSEYDCAETLLDRRILSEHVKFPCRILDIGPGCGRHLVNAFLSAEHRNSVYVGIESIGLPYSIQNSVASCIWLQDKTTRFFEYIDYEFARREFPKIQTLPANSIVHLPLWKASLLPERYFDLIICSYVLDEVPADDFVRIADIIGRCLADEGVVYCRGSQQRAMIKDMYLYGSGTFHGQDITKTLLSKGLRVAKCEVIASQLTRLFVSEHSKTHSGTGGKYTAFREDIPLVDEIQKDFVAVNIKELEESRKKVLIWGDSGYSHYLNYVEPYKDAINIIGLTKGSVVGASATTRARIREYLKYIMPYLKRLNIIGLMSAAAAKVKVEGGIKAEGGIKEYSPSDFPSLSPDVVIILSMRDASILRQIRQMSSPGEFRLMRKFNYPIAFAYRS